MTDILEDREFWGRLAFYTCGWLRVAPEKELRRCWIDDFIPASICRTNAFGEVRGTAWVMRRNAGVECMFIGIIPWSIINRDRVNIEIVNIKIDLERKAVEVTLQRRIAKPPNQALEPTTLAVTPCAPSRTSRASQGRGSSLTLGEKTNG